MKVLPLAGLANSRRTSTLGLVEPPLIVGTPDNAIAEIERYQRASRVTHLVMWMQLAGMDPKKAESCMKLFAQEVMPHFRRWSACRQAVRAGPLAARCAPRPPPV